jgi:hypothetical protein
MQVRYNQWVKTEKLEYYDWVNVVRTTGDYKIANRSTLRNYTLAERIATYFGVVVDNQTRIISEAEKSQFAKLLKYDPFTIYYAIENGLYVVHALYIDGLRLPWGYTKKLCKLSETEYGRVEWKGEVRDVWDYISKLDVKGTACEIRPVNSSTYFCFVIE